MTDYRIRWAIVHVPRCRHFESERRCIAERKTWLGWWPVRDSDWRRREVDAIADAEHDRYIREALPKPRLLK